MLRGPKIPAVDPLKPAFSLSGAVPTLSSLPEQITANAVVCGVEGPCCSMFASDLNVS